MVAANSTITQNSTASCGESSKATKLPKSKDQSVVCDVCGKRINRLPDLKRHMLRHADNMEALKLKCTFPGCNYSTLQKGNFEIHQNMHMGIKNFVCDQLVPSKEDPDVMVPCTFKSTHPGSLPRHLFRKHGVKYPLHERRKTRAQAADAISKAKRGRKNRKGKQTHVPSVTGEFGPCIPALSTPNLLFADLPALTGSSTQGSASSSGSTSSDSEPDYRAALLNGLSMSSWSNDFDVNFMLEPSLAPPYREDGTLDFGSGFAACSSYPAVASSSSSDPFADVDLLSGLTFPSMGSDLNNQMGLSTTNNTPFDVVYSGSQQEFGPFVSTQEDKVYVPPQQPFNLTGGGYISESNNHSLYNAQSSTPFTLPASQEFPGFESAPMYTFPTQGNLGFSSFQPYETNSLYPSMNSNLYF